jgi:hypothetical protein
LERLELRTPLSTGIGPSLASGAVIQTLPSSFASLGPLVGSASTPFGLAGSPQEVLDGPLARPAGLQLSTLTLPDGLYSRLPHGGEGTIDLSFAQTFGPVVPPDFALTDILKSQENSAPLLVSLGAGTSFAGEFFTLAEQGVLAGPAWSEAIFVGVGPLGGFLHGSRFTPEPSNPDAPTPNVVGPALDVAYGEDGPPLDGIPIPGEPLLLAPRIALVKADLNTIESELSFAGPLSTTQSNTSSLFLAALPAASTGRTLGLAQTNLTAGPSAQTDVPGDVGAGGWMSFLATGGWRVPSFPLPTLGANDAFTLERNSETVASPFSLVGGESLASILLSGPDVPSQGASSDLQQIAELIPSDESPLALVATLWTVSSDWKSPAFPPANTGEIPAASITGVEESPVSNSPSPWAVYVIGLDQAFEQSCRDVQLENSSSWESSTHEQPAENAGDLSLWLGPVFATPSGACFGRLEQSPEVHANPGVEAALYAPQAQRSQSPLVSSEALSARDSDAPSGQVSSEPLGVVRVAATGLVAPFVSAVTVSTVAAGWFWARHKSISPHASPGRLWHRPRRNLNGAIPRLYPQACRSLP